MPKTEYDSKGLPVAKTKNPGGNLTIRLDDAAWLIVGQLRQRWSAERGMNLAITDVIRGCVYHTRDLVIGGPMVETQRIGPPAPETCLACNTVPEGEAYQCLGCGRSLAENQQSDLMVIQGEAKATEAKREAVKETVAKPAPVRPSRKKKG